jgi:hypothetical protein
VLLTAYNRRRQHECEQGNYRRLGFHQSPQYRPS